MLFTAELYRFGDISWERLSAGLRQIVLFLMPHTFSPLPSFRKPLVSLFPALFKQNLLSFIHLVSPCIPRSSVLQLLKCLSQDSNPNPWVSSLVRQLDRNMGAHSEEALYTPECGQRLKELSQRFVGAGETGGWARCLSGHTMGSVIQNDSPLSDWGTQRKRKISFVTQDSDGDETGQRGKRIKVDYCGGEDLDAAGLSGKEARSGGTGGNASADTPIKDLHAAPDSPCHDLPEHMKVRTADRICSVCSVLHRMKYSAFISSFLVICSS